MRMPNLNALRMFDAAARHLNFRRAAEEMAVTQGAVAQQVRGLEADIGVRLFHREARGLSLTEVGRDYHRPIRRALAIIEGATQKLSPDSPRVTLSVPPSFASKWLVPRLAAFTEAMPDIDLQTVASAALADFQSDHVDVAIRQGEPPFGRRLHSECFAPLALCAVCSRDYAASVEPADEIGSFASHHLIQDGHKHWDRLFQTVDVQPARRMIQFNQTSLAMDAAANGQGIALVPKLLLDADLGSGTLVVLWEDPSVNPSGFYLVWPSGGEPNRRRDAVVEWLLSKA